MTKFVVEGNYADGDGVTRNLPVLIGGVDTNGNAQTLTTDTSGNLSLSGSLTTTPPSDTPSFQNAISAKTLVRGSAGVLGGIYSLYNPNAVDVFVQVFDAASTGAVTLGTTVPKLSVWVPTVSAYDASFARAIAFAAGIVFAVTTTATGSTAPTTGITGTFAHAAS